MTRVVTFGEIMLRLSPPGQERFFQSPSLRTWFGGSEVNVAVGLAHLGTASVFVTRIPENALGDGALAAVRAEGVDARWMQRGGPRLGTYYVESGVDLRGMRVVYDRTGSAFATLEPSSFDWPAILTDARWLHLSGITPALGDGPARAADDAIAAARRAGIMVSLDLNYRPALWTGRDAVTVIAPLAKRVDLLIGNPGAVEAMLGIGGDSLAMSIHNTLGCARVALTTREVVSASEHRWSASLYDASSAATHQARPYTVRVVDRVGGGDSFAAALIHAQMAGRDAATSLAFATAASALKLTIPGDFNRVSASEVERVMEASA